MGLFSRNTGRKTGGKAEKRDVIVAPISSASALQTVPDFGVAVNNRSALNLTALFAGIRIISENVASLPKVVRRYDPERGQLEDRRHAAYRAINVRPNSYTNVFDFWACIVTWVIGWGNAYALIRRRGDGSIELHQIHPSCVTITIVNGRKWYKVVMINPDLADFNGVYSDDEILHFMLITTDGVIGLNPVVYNAMAIGKAIATEQFGSEFFARGGNIRAVMETDGEMGEDDYQVFMQRFNDSSRNFQTPLLEYGIKYKQLNVEPIAAQLVQSETLSIQDVARILNLPPHMLGELSHATFSNIEHQTIQFVKYTLRPLVKRLEVELESKLFFSREIDLYGVKFVLDGLLRGDTAARSTFYHNAILDGYMSRNEVREMEGMERKEGLDAFLYPLNTGVVGDDGNMEENQD